VQRCIASLCGDRELERARGADRELDRMQAIAKHELDWSRAAKSSGLVVPRSRTAYSRGGVDHLVETEWQLRCIVHVAHALATKAR
jgi:hypothetical protein